MKTAAITAAGIILLGSAIAQQAPASNPPQAQPAKPTQTTAPKPKTATAAKTPAPLVLKTDKDKTSYALGMVYGSRLKADSVDIDPAIFLRGLKDTLAGGKVLLTDDQAKSILTALQADVNKRQEAKMQLLRETNKKEGDTFLAANKTKEDVVALPSGLQYKVLTEGTGPRPAATDTVVCNYKGTLINGTEFDSSYKRGQPATFPVNGVIKGWTEALQLMPVGSKWQLFIPSDLAYGPGGRGSVIGPNATLIFEVELVSIKPKAQ
jgi:FKBP-type peptidyl-prolyl cis-trans isomerase